MKNAKPRRTENFMSDGRCENCGKDIRKWVWVYREHTACSKACVEECDAADLRELAAQPPVVGKDFVEM